MIHILEPSSRLNRVLVTEAKADAGSVERKIAGARIFLAAACLLLAFWDPAAGGYHGSLIRACLIGYLAFAIAIRLLLRLRARAGDRLIMFLHGLDVVFAASLTATTPTKIGAYGVFLIFVLMSAAWRWGFRATLATGAAAAVLVLVASAIFETPLHQLGHEETLLLPDLVIPAFYLSVLGITAGFMTAALRRLYAESYMISRIARSIHPDAGMEANLGLVCGAVLNLTGGGELLLLAQESANGDPSFWRAARDDDGVCTAGRACLGPEGLDRYFFPAPGRIWCWEHGTTDSEPARQCRTLDEERESIRQEAMWLPDGFRTAHPCRLLLVAAWSTEQVFRMRLFILDPNPEMRRVGPMLFFHKLMARMIPALVDVCVARRARLKAAALERSSLVRELHDGVVQALITIEMQLAAHRQLCVEKDPALVEQICRIQEQLRHETANLRIQMQQLREQALTPRECLLAIRAVAEQQLKDSGIPVRVEADLEAVMLPPASCSELVRIVQEALVNVRKHSGATAVEVRLEQAEGEIRCTIRDNGEGFGFAGRRTLAELDAAGVGPAVLKERVRLIGGDLEIESTPGVGSRLEITIPGS